MASELPHLHDTVSKFALFSVSSLKDKKLIKNANLHENWNMQTLFWSLLNISAKFHQNWSLPCLSYTVSKLVHFLKHSVLTSSDNFSVIVLQITDLIQTINAHIYCTTFITIIVKSDISSLAHSEWISCIRVPSRTGIHRLKYHAFKIYTVHNVTLLQPW